MNGGCEDKQWHKYAVRHGVRAVIVEGAGSRTTNFGNKGAIKGQKMIMVVEARGEAGWLCESMAFFVRY
jgi:hypothetical protein